ncbi:Receptor-interacting serine/threonine-protein kinase 4 [Metarhizium anisopliae]|nr:Receptor-interacting serine/threonine-protein kinase 4 [Metarhizium anisopliae]
MSFLAEQGEEQGDPTLPIYSATDEGSLRPGINRVSDVDSPISYAPANPPPYNTSERPNEEHRHAPSRHQAQADTVWSFFDAIQRGLGDKVERLIATGLVSPNTTSRSGQTPLLAAVRVRDSSMVRRLLSRGATVNGYGKITINWDTLDRTALQLAAETGSLAIVKILMEEFHADDSLIAPDGALALRLAAANGYREIVDYLPKRRGGAWKRWRFAHREEMDRIRTALDKIRTFVVFFVWQVPKGAAQAAAKTLKSAWKRRHEFADWARLQVKGLPSRLAAAGASIARGVRKIPRWAKSVAFGIWRLIRAVPSGVRICANWVGDTLGKAGHWVVHVVKRTASFFHTVVAAVLSWLRQITLRDVWNGFCSVLQAVFVAFPTLLWSFVKSFGDVMYGFMGAVFGLLGLCLWGCVAGIVSLLCYIPCKIWQCIEAVGRMIAKTVEEILVYFDPKRMSAA